MSYESYPQILILMFRVRKNPDSYYTHMSRGFVRTLSSRYTPFYVFMLPKVAFLWPLAMCQDLDKSILDRVFLYQSSRLIVHTSM